MRRGEMRNQRYGVASAAGRSRCARHDPVVDASDGSELGREGCLSLPDVTANVRRATRVTVSGIGADGARASFSTEGFEARALLHEIDRLDGILILDRVASPSEIFRASAARSCVAG